MRLAIFGGMFDPPHLGHITLAGVTVEQLEVDTMLFIPTGDHPLKQLAGHSQARHRYEMTKLAVKDNPVFEVSGIEIIREGPSYTVDTLEEIQRLYSPEKLYLCIGADNAAIFDRWHDPNRILELSTVVVWRRPGESIPDSPLIGRMQLLDTPLMNISSTEIRNLVREGKSIKDRVPPAVEDYILTHNLYRY